MKNALGQQVSLRQGIGRFTTAMVAALTLSGCVSTRYISTHCVTKGQLEELKKSQPGRIGRKLTGNAEKDSRILAGNLIRLRAHDDGLLEVLGGCVDPSQ
jgi:hypothetical protein